MPSNKIVKTQTIIASKGDSFILNRWRATHEIFIFSAFLLFLCIFISYYLLKCGVTWDNYQWIYVLVIFFPTGLGVLYEAIIQIKNEKAYKKIKFEDLHFNKCFNVYSADQVEARYLVSTAFMDRLQNLQTAFGTKNIKCSFFDDKVMFVIPTKKDLFEIGNLFAPLGDKKLIEEFYKELNSIYNIIDYFKLTEKTGL